MWKIFFSVTAFLFAARLSGYCQEDSTRYINGLPVSEDDTAETLVPDVEPKNELHALAPDALPPELRKTLMKDDLYRGWQDTTVYLEANTGLYLVPVKTGNSIRTYGFDQRGKPVTFDEVDRPRR